MEEVLKSTSIFLHITLYRIARFYYFFFYWIGLYLYLDIIFLRLIPYKFEKKLLYPKGGKKVIYCLLIEFNAELFIYITLLRNYIIIISLAYKKNHTMNEL